MKLSKGKQQQLILVGLITVCACAGLWFGLVERRRAHRAGVTARVAQTVTKVADMDKMIASRKLIASNLEEATQKLAEREAQFADGDLYSWFIVRLREFRARYAVETPNISREVAGDVKLLPSFPYKQASYQVRGSGFYSDLGRFIADFENKFPYARLTNLELSPDQTPGNSESEKLSFKVDVCVLIKPSQAVP